MLISPAEPRQLRELGTTSSTPEKYGSDFLIHSPTFGVVGIQRKELNDLVASLTDDRISREIIAMKELDHAIWLIEGVPQWSSDGQLLSTRTRYTLTQHRGFLFTLLFQGFSLLSTVTLTDTGLLLSQLEKWLGKEKHRGINGRQPPRGMFGSPDVREWQIHFLQGLPGLGYERANAIVSHYGGLPLRLCEGVSLEDVAGVGKNTAKRIEGVFGELP